MTKNLSKLCKSKNCNNPVLNGKYCEYCKQKRKENRNQILEIGAMGGTLVVGALVAVKKGVVNKVPEIAAKVIGSLLHL